MASIPDKMSRTDFRTAQSIMQFCVDQSAIHVDGNEQALILHRSYFLQSR
jgi:hypothetical protein